LPHRHPERHAWNALLPDLPRAHDEDGAEPGHPRPRPRRALPSLVKRGSADADRRRDGAAEALRAVGWERSSNKYVNDCVRTTPPDTPRHQLRIDDYAFRDCDRRFARDCRRPRDHGGASGRTFLQKVVADGSIDPRLRANAFARLSEHRSLHELSTKP